MIIGYVLDSSVVIAILNRENGADRAVELAVNALISTVNYAEVVSKLVVWGYDALVIHPMLDAMHLSPADFDAPQALSAGFLRATTRTKGLSLGDRARLALAESTGRIALTADRAWADLEIGVTIELIR